MPIELRSIADEELDAFVRVAVVAFGATTDEETFAQARRILQPERTLAAFEDGRIVASSASLGLDLTLPGLTTIPVTGITWVGVLPTHRRRGLLRAMMSGLLDESARHGEPVAALYAAESLLYGRYGFGAATSGVGLELDSRHGHLVVTPDPGGRTVLLEPDEAAKVLPAVHDRARRAQPGDLGRSPGLWGNYFHDSEKERGGASAMFHVVHESPGGQADGYATYRMKPSEGPGPPGRVVVVELVCLGTDAAAALWRYLLDMDLTEVVEARCRPVEDPLRWMLADPRRLRVSYLADMLWVRLLDVPAALAARRYGAGGHLVLEVADAFRPASAGRYVLEGGADGADCRRTGDEPDLALDAADLGALLLGGVAASTLAAAGRMSERRPGALRAGRRHVRHAGPALLPHRVLSGQRRRP